MCNLLYVLELPRTPMPADVDAVLPCEWCDAPDGRWRPDPDIGDFHETWGEVRCDVCQGRIDDIREIARQRQSLTIEPGTQILDWRESDRASG
jgi:hypothetical protein